MWSRAAMYGLCKILKSRGVMQIKPPSDRSTPRAQCQPPYVFTELVHPSDVTIWEWWAARRGACGTLTTTPAKHFRVRVRKDVSPNRAVVEWVAQPSLSDASPYTCGQGTQSNTPAPDQHARTVIQSMFPVTLTGASKAHTQTQNKTTTRNPKPNTEKPVPVNWSDMEHVLIAGMAFARCHGYKLYMNRHGTSTTPNSPSSIQRTSAGGYAPSSSTATTVDALLKHVVPAHAWVVVGDMQGCPYSRKARDVALERCGGPAAVHIVDTGMRGAPLRASVTSRYSTVPQVWHNGRHIGGCSDLVAYLN